MAKSRTKLKGRREEGTFGLWPHACAGHANFAALSINSRALILDFLGQSNGYNNGDLTAAFAVLKTRGWKSRTTVDKACAELEEKGWIVRTRQGGKNRCNLYGFTFRGIDDCKGKLDVPSSAVPLGFWKTGQNPWRLRDQPQRPKRSGVTSKHMLWAKDAHAVGMPVPIES